MPQTIQKNSGIKAAVFLFNNPLLPAVISTETNEVSAAEKSFLSLSAAFWLRDFSAVFLRETSAAFHKWKPSAEQHFFARQGSASLARLRSK